MENYYLCNKCTCIKKRNSKAKNIKSFCTETNKDAVLSRIDNANELAVTIRNKWLSNSIDLSSFKPKEIIFLEIAFDRGATILFNLMKEA